MYHMFIHHEIPSSSATAITFLSSASIFAAWHRMICASISLTKLVISVFDRVENIVGKGLTLS